MNLLYIGENLRGTTSECRRHILEERFGIEADVVDFNKYLARNRIIRSLKWRMQSPYLMRAFNQRLQSVLMQRYWELIWVDKGMFVSPESFRLIESQGKRRVFFTPDTLFWNNSSGIIHNGLKKFDVVATTKSFEVTCFSRYMEPQNLMLVKQGYSPIVTPQSENKQKRDIPIGFIGKYERHRGQVIKKILAQGLEVHVAGRGWGKFRSHHPGQNLIYHGEALFGDEYTTFYARCLIGLGLLSKKFPELHTTRTFEIPALGAALATERTRETNSFYNESEAIFYDNIDELARKLKVMLSDQENLRQVARKGRSRVLTEGVSWSDQVGLILERVEL